MIAPHVSMRVAAGVVCLFFLAAAATAFHPPQQKPSQRKAFTPQGLIFISPAAALKNATSWKRCAAVSLSSITTMMDGWTFSW
ncbi:MAG: hypothetical protein DMG75_12440 [Acidobacteria bacterium]|nr:MAG: hypothetical protein DMG75_12440 [Acidobacteriota bacterium]